jgi:hypothetical protein
MKPSPRINKKDRNDFSGFVDKNAWYNFMLDRAQRTKELIGRGI